MISGLNKVAVAFGWSYHKVRNCSLSENEGVSKSCK